MIGPVMYDMFLVIYKNTLLDLRSPYQLLGEFLMPLQICGVIFLMHYEQNSILSLLFSSLLPFYIGNVSNSLVRKFAVFFVTERQQKFGMYQRVLGLSKMGYFLGNLHYAYLFTSMVIAPVWAVLTYYKQDFGLVFFFASYVVCSNCFMLMLISFFKDPKVCSEVVGIVSSLSVFLYYLVDLNNLQWYSFPIMMIPYPGFALSVVGDSKKAASMMLLSAKLFLVIYAWREFDIHPLHQCRSCIDKCKGQSSELNQEIEMESLDSQAKVRPRVLSIKHLTKTFNNFTALNNLTLSILKGEILSLLGRNGAGKTTLIDIITGMQSPSHGSVTFVNEAGTPRIGVCYQQQILYQQFSVEQIVKYYVLVKRQDRNEVERVLTQVELFEERHKTVKDLSGGMKRRLSLAIAIIGDPQLLILDQPTSGLDPHSRRAVWEIIKRLKSQQKSILLTTHHLDQAQALSDRVCVIERGSSLVLGSPIFIKKKFGIGYQLTVYGSDQHARQQQKVLARYANIEGQTVDSNTRKYVLRMRDQQHFGDILKDMESIKGIEISLQLNSLQEAFMGIINDPELVARPHDEHRVVFQLERSRLVQRRPFRASFAKNLLLIKRSPLKYLALYNLNLLFLCVGIAVAGLFEHITANNFDVFASEQLAKQAASMMKKVMLLQGYYFSIGVYVTNAVYEKEKKIVSVLRVRGMDWISYWLPQLAIDFAIFEVNLCVLLLIVGKSIDVVFFSMFGLSLIIYCYCCSFLFNSSTRATKFFPLINFSFGFLMPIVNLLGDSLKKDILLGILRFLYPFYPVQNSLMPSVVLQGSSSMSVWPFVFQIVFYISLLAAIELKLVQRLRNRDQVEEQVSEAVKFRNVKKTYGLQEALKSLSLDVSQSEILGLLGPNGAGKSTTFKLMTSLQRPTGGEIYLEHKRHFPYQTTFESLGVCYQQDTLWQTLTGAEILTIFGHLVGIENIGDQSLYLADKLEIETLDRKFDQLSGGNKRKCCMAACLMGRPKCAFLDQCSTGLDPMSRRSMVRFIGAYRDSTIVFTTHSMNEAQTLCNKIAILVQGSLKEHGTVKELKDKYHPSYFLEVHSDQETYITKDKLKAVIPGVTVRSQLGDQNKMYCSVNKSETRLSNLYSALTKLKLEQSIRDFSVYEPNLEDVYLQIIKTG